MEKVKKSVKGRLSHFFDETKKVTGVYTELKRQSPTFRHVLFCAKCTAVGFLIGLVFMRRVYIPTVLGFGYGIGRNIYYK